MSSYCGSLSSDTVAVKMVRCAGRVYCTYVDGRRPVRLVKPLADTTDTRTSAARAASAASLSPRTAMASSSSAVSCARSDGWSCRYVAHSSLTGSANFISTCTEPMMEPSDTAMTGTAVSLARPLWLSSRFSGTTARPMGAWDACSTPITSTTTDDVAQCRRKYASHVTRYDAEKLYAGSAPTAKGDNWDSNP